MGRHELTDDQWTRLEPLLPPRKPRVGRENLDHRPVLNGMLWRCKTGSPWRDMPERYGPWDRVYQRFRRWRRHGVWARVLAALQQGADAQGQVDWTLHFVDGSVVRAHQHAAGAKKGAGSKPSVGAGVASARSSTSGSSAAASPSPSR